MCMHVHIHVHACRGQKSTLDNFLCHSSLIFLRQGLPLNLELADLTKPAIKFRESACDHPDLSTGTGTVEPLMPKPVLAVLWI